MSARIMLFEKETEEKLYKIAKHNGIKFSYYYGYIVEFDKVNVDGERYTMYEIKKYIRNYFKNNSNINETK